MIEAALAESQGRIAGPSGAAAKLGIPRQTLDSKIAGLGIDKRRFKAQCRQLRSASRRSQALPKSGSVLPCFPTSSLPTLNLVVLFQLCACSYAALLR